MINSPKLESLAIRMIGSATRACAVCTVVSIIVVGPTSGNARPPTPGSTQAQDMAPYSAEIRGLRDVRGRECCDVSDCRRVRAEVRDDGHWWVLVGRNAFPDGTDQWQVVPDEAIVPAGRRPMLPWPLACWAWFPGLSRGVFQCFTPPMGV